MASSTVNISELVVNTEDRSVVMPDLKDARPSCLAKFTDGAYSVLL